MICGRSWKLTLVSLAAATSAAAQMTDKVVKIGVLNDQSGLYADLSGQGSVIAAKLAAEDFGGKVEGTPIEVIFADHQNKPDVGSNIARQSCQRLARRQMCWTSSSKRLSSLRPASVGR